MARIHTLNSDVWIIVQCMDSSHTSEDLLAKHGPSFDVWDNTSDEWMNIGVSKHRSATASMFELRTAAETREVLTNWYDYTLPLNNRVV